MILARHPSDRGQRRPREVKFGGQTFVQDGPPASRGHAATPKGRIKLVRRAMAMGHPPAEIIESCRATYGRPYQDWAQAVDVVCGTAYARLEAPEQGLPTPEKVLETMRKLARGPGKGVVA